MCCRHGAAVPQAHRASPGLSLARFGSSTMVVVVVYSGELGFSHTKFFFSSQGTSFQPSGREAAQCSMSPLLLGSLGAQLDQVTLPSPFHVHSPSLVVAVPAAVVMAVACAPMNTTRSPAVCR